jgi:hypothetical protein
MAKKRNETKNFEKRKKNVFQTPDLNTIRLKKFSRYNVKSVN